MIGLRFGIAGGPRVGLAVGVGANELTAPPVGGGGIPGVTRDAASQWYFPASAAEWTAFMTAIGLGTGNPTTTHNCQEPSGALVDAISGVNLAQSGAGHLYQQPVTGFTRKAVMCVDGTVGQKWINSTTAPDPSAVSTLWLAAISFPVSAPAANRCLMANAAALDCRLTTTSRLAIINGASTNGASNPLGGVHMVGVQHNITAGTFIAFTDQEKITGTFAVNAANPMFVLGGQTAAAAGVGYLWEAEFAGAAAEGSSANIKALIQGLTGITVPWS